MMLEHLPKGPSRAQPRAELDKKLLLALKAASCFKSFKRCKNKGFE